MPNVEHLIPLSLLATGQTAHIGQLVGHVDQVHRLEELGFRCGIEVEMIQSGSPCIVRIGGHRICFRENEGLSVLVRTGVAS